MKMKGDPEVGKEEAEEKIAKNKGFLCL